jgi:hypothetical protein
MPYAEYSTIHHSSEDASNDKSKMAKAGITVMLFFADTLISCT